MPQERPRQGYDGQRRSRRTTGGVINSYSQGAQGPFLDVSFYEVTTAPQNLGPIMGISPNLISLSFDIRAWSFPPSQNLCNLGDSMIAEFENQVAQTLEEIKAQGLFKTERVITSPQDAHIAITGGKSVLNMCANNYLGLADHPALIAAAKEALETHGFGMASVRFICGTQDIHKELEAALTKFLGTHDTILYPSCFDANGGLFETLLTDKDAVISDELNHASIIDGIRLCKAQRFRYKHNDM